MSNGYWKLAGSDFQQDWSDTSLISTNDDWSKVASIIGYRGDGLTTLTGVDPRTITGTSGQINVIANQLNPSTLTTGGVAEFQIANPVVALQGSGTAAAPYLELFLDATGRENVTLSFDARDVDASPTDNSVQQIAVQYRLGDGGTWANVPGGYIADATTGPGIATLVTPLSVVLPSMANNAANLQVRVMTTNAVGNDEWVGIDNIAVTSSSPVNKVPGALNIADASTIEGNAGTHPIGFTVSRIGGAAGAVDAHYTVTLPGGTGGADAGDFAPGTAFSGTVHFDDGQASATIALPVTGDTAPEFDERFSVTLSDPTGGATITRATATGTILNDDVLPLLIGQIQGAAHTSPVNGQTVQTQGVVTGVDTNGFYLQDYGDGDARTSDGVFVFTGSAPDVYVGDFLSVKAAVSEYQAGTGGLTVTELTKPDISVISWGNALPDAVVIGDGGIHPPTQAIDDDGLKSFDPKTDGIDFWESLEGMRVTMDHPMAVSNTTTDSFAETWVVASDGRGATGINDRGGITLAADDANPEKIQIEGRPALSGGFDPHYTVGDQLSNVTGIVSYAAADYQLIVTDPVTVEKDVTLQREVTNLSGNATHLSLATYNLENYDASDHKDGTLAANIVTNLHLPDIIGVEEVQDADGAGNGTDLSGAKTAQGLIDAINAISGAHYAYVEIAPSAPNTTGGEPNGNIRSGYFYNTDRVGYVDGSAQLITGAAYNNSRNPLVAQFTFNGQTVTTIDVHLTSRGGSDSDWGANQPPAEAGDASRTAQAAGVQAYVQSHLADNPNLNIAVMGDWNGFSWENAQTQLTDPAKGGKLTDLNTLLPSQERYSYLFDGNAQQLDHILVTPGLLSGAQYDSVHINSQFAEDDRPTDHDPQLAVFALGAQPAAHTELASVDAVSDAGSGLHAAFAGGAADTWLSPYDAMADHGLHLA